MINWLYDEQLNVHFWPKEGRYVCYAASSVGAWHFWIVRRGQEERLYEFYFNHAPNDVVQLLVNAALELVEAREDNLVLRAMVHDLQESSTAYQMGLEDGRTRVVTG